MEPGQTPKQREREDEEEHEQKHEHLNGHNDPHCLKWGAERAPVSGRIRRIESDCQAIGRDVRMIHHRETLYPSGYVGPVPSEQVRGEPEWSGSPQRRVNLNPIYGIIKQQN